MAFLIIIEASGLDFLFWGLSVDSSGQDLLTSVLLPQVPEPLFFFLSVFIFSRLYRIVTWRSWLWIFGLRFVGAGWVHVAGALVCTLEKVLQNGRWPLGQLASDFQTMMLDFRPAMTSTFTAFCTISLKFVDSPSCCFISTLMEGLRSFWK